jgi:hypothetical protein
LFQTPRLVSLALGNDVTGAALAYGNPFPADWGEVLELSISIGVAYDLPSGETGEVYAAISHVVGKDPSGAAGLAPLVGPVGDLRVNGESATDHDLEGVGESPTVSWSPPAVGQASAYVVEILGFETYGSFTLAWPVVTLYTNGTAAPIPPHLLVAGTPCVVSVTAVAMPGIDLPTHPNRHALPEARVPAFSALVTP